MNIMNAKIEWVKIENRPENKSNIYYISGENKNLVLTMDDQNNEIMCKLPDGSEKKLKLFCKMFEDFYYDSSGTKICLITKKWFVKDETQEYPLDEIEVSKDDIVQYKNNE